MVKINMKIDCITLFFLNSVNIPSTNFSGYNFLFIYKFLNIEELYGDVFLP